MKLDRRHMAGSLAILASSIVYNVWVFTRPAARAAATGAPAEIVGEASMDPGPGSGARAVAIDPSQVPNVPDVGLQTLPKWRRDPFQNLRERPQAVVADTTDPEPAAPTPPAIEADPVVASILYSSGRRLAMIDGHIVRAGDRVGGATVVAVLPKGVVVESAYGERRTIELKAPSTGRGRQ